MRRMAVFQGVRMLRFGDALGQCEARDLSQLEAAEVLGVSERTFRHWCRRFEGEGEAGLVDQRLGKPSAKRVPLDEALQVEELNRSRYAGFTMKHFHERLCVDHVFRWGYTWSKTFLHGRGLVAPTPRRPLVVFRDGKVYGELNGSTDIFRRDFDAKAVKKFDGKWITGWAAAQEGRKGEKPFRTYRVAEGAKWNVDPFTSAEQKAKPFKPGTQLYNDIHAMALAGNRLYTVHKDGRLKILNTTDGSVVAERKVPAPMWDGLAIAQGKIFLSTLGGEVVCLGNISK